MYRPPNSPLKPINKNLLLPIDHLLKSSQVGQDFAEIVSSHPPIEIQNRGSGSFSSVRPDTVMSQEVLGFFNSHIIPDNAIIQDSSQVDQTQDSLNLSQIVQTQSNLVQNSPSNKPLQCADSSPSNNTQKLNSRKKKSDVQAAASKTKHKKKSERDMTQYDNLLEKLPRTPGKGLEKRAKNCKKIKALFGSDSDENPDETMSLKDQPTCTAPDMDTIKLDENKKTLVKEKVATQAEEELANKKLPDQLRTPKKQLALAIDEEENANRTIVKLAEQTEGSDSEAEMDDDENVGPPKNPIKCTLIISAQSEVLVRPKGSKSFKQIHTAVAGCLYGSELTPKKIHVTTSGLPMVMMKKQLVKQEYYICCVEQCSSKNIKYYRQSSSLSKHCKTHHPQVTKEKHRRLKALYYHQLLAAIKLKIETNAEIEEVDSEKDLPPNSRPKKTSKTKKTE